MPPLGRPALRARGASGRGAGYGAGVAPDGRRPARLAGRLNGASLAAAAKALKLPAGATREHVDEAARRRDVQIAPDMGPLQGVFDGLGLSGEERSAVLANWHAFGRRERRTMRAPHDVVLAEHDSPLEVQGADFRRARDAELKRVAAASPAWKAARRARHAGVRFLQASMERDWSADIAATVAARDGDAPHRVVEAPAAVEVFITPVFEGPSTNLCFTHAPGQSPKSIHWFASCIATALGHPRAKAFERDDGPLGAYASHELAGAVYVVSACGNEATCAAGRAVSRGGLVYAAHPTVAEGACDLFAPQSVERLGLYCPFGDGRGWTNTLVRRVLLLLKPGGTVHTNCAGVSSGFIKRAAQGVLI